MAELKVQRTTVGPLPFELVGSDLAKPANDFLEHLATLDRSPYTIRSYALGLRHFLGWTSRERLALRDITRHQIGLYIRHFVEGEPKKARTINHRLSLLSSFFRYLIERDAEHEESAWFGTRNPVPGSQQEAVRVRGVPVRDAPRHGRRADFRRREPRRIPKRLEPTEVERLISAAGSWRDKAILRLLYRTGQRIGDWSRTTGRHGVLGLALEDIDAKSRTVVVRLKGARDQHRVPVANDFWPVYEKYLAVERQAPKRQKAAWLGFRRAQGKPLTYSAFEASLRYAARKAGLRVNAHMLRHTMAQMILESSGNLKVAQELLGHAHVSTTADVYMYLDEAGLVRAVAEATARTRELRSATGARGKEPRYAFPYDELTITELDRLADGHAVLAESEKVRS